MMTFAFQGYQRTVSQKLTILTSQSLNVKFIMEQTKDLIHRASSKKRQISTIWTKRQLRICYNQTCKIKKSLRWRLKTLTSYSTINLKNVTWIRRENPLNLSILVRGGKEINWDSESIRDTHPRILNITKRGNQV